MRAALLVLLFGIFTANAWAQSAPSSTDSRKVAWVDPRSTFASHPKYTYQLQVGNVGPSITSIAEPGWLDSKIGQYTVMRTTDPVGGAKKAFRHKIAKGMTYTNGSTARAGILGAWNGPSVLKDGVPYWAGYAFYVDKDHPFNGTGGDMSILSLGHAVSSKNQQSMNVLFLNRNGTLRFLISSNRVLNGTSSTYVGKSFSKPIQKGVWHYVILQWKYEWDAAKGPYTKVWHVVGNDAPSSSPWVNSNIANAFNESSGYHPWKFMQYMWDVNAWGSSPTRTLYTKGVHIFRDQAGSPALNVNSMLALMRSI